MMKTLTGSINLSKISKENLFTTESGDKYLDFKVIFKDGKFDSVAFIPQTFLKDNRKDSNGDWVQTPILGYLKEMTFDKKEDSIESKDLPF